MYKEHANTSCVKPTQSNMSKKRSWEGITISGGEARSVIAVEGVVLDGKDERSFNLLSNLQETKQSVQRAKRSYIVLTRVNKTQLKPMKLHQGPNKAPPHFPPARECLTGEMGIGVHPNQSLMTEDSRRQVVELATQQKAAAYPSEKKWEAATNKRSMPYAPVVVPCFPPWPHQMIHGGKTVENRQTGFKATQTALSGGRFPPTCESFQFYIQETETIDKEFMATSKVDSAVPKAAIVNPEV